MLLKLKSPVNDEHISNIQNLSFWNDKDENNDVVLMKDMRKIVAYWSENQAPPKDLIHVIIEALGGSTNLFYIIIFSLLYLPLNAQKIYSCYCRATRCWTGIICNTLIQPFSSVQSRAGDRTSLINASLTRKLPVSFYEEIKFPQLVDFIETKNDECRSNISKHISHLLTDIVEKQNLNNTLEDMLHWGMDSIFRILIQIFHENLDRGILPIEMDRNSKDQEQQRLFMICYATAGTRLRFFAIDGSQNTNPPSSLIALSNQLNMNNRRDHVSILSIMVNIARIMRTVSNTIPEMIVPFGKRNEEEARAMSQSVLTGLNWLHKGGYVHRDIRLPNLLFIPGDEDFKYVLNDFEHANVDGLVTTERLKDWDNKTLTKLQHNLICINLERSYTVNSEAGKKFLDGLR
ncbi:crinkler family protein [Gigaspora margarita]|uniref:Crinkler family protein n=1 Tax=Gigaspora margarita TaxID=4874 RepID=A0A8H3XJX5_GIGMA|nr:crinkler family protein [Gigaspora margarita]